jgi:hypothetical protein
MTIAIALRKKILLLIKFAGSSEERRSISLPRNIYIPTSINPLAKPITAKERNTYLLAYINLCKLIDDLSINPAPDDENGSILDSNHLNIILIIVVFYGYLYVLDEVLGNE